ncbi:ArsR/SmtB family transcription factor [Actinophytocola gossypii]|uniref:Helix-turn-helix domain-containing protein n=1 Tax=Actinophytocola gossypii TaxID=2812003 RepID=A0ABT2JB56_9PSEU|nr:helix-turn-helix domain-containing protein [Actinophytocola gossypii]MCT2584529.1 helix-turn-helix domain-containing protein [Actinophytocola gossypii]
MSSGNKHSHSTDPRALRALAHPVRLDLLYLIEREGPLTASRAAELLGLTPKVCSYHLNQLGRYGVVEETGEGKGRSRPWRLAIADITYVHDPDEEPATTRADDAFAKAMLARDAKVIETFIDDRHGLPLGWRNVSTMSSNPLRLTPEQLRELGRELTEVVERYRTMSREPAEGAHPVHIVLYALPTELTGLTD